MDLALDRLRRAIAGGEKILIYGDYDVDGTTSVVILKRAIELAGGTPEFHVPNRLKDGYGMRAEVVEEAALKGVSLIISVDTGIRAAAVVRRAAELGIDVIITDHHLPEAELPPALAVLNPNRPDCAYPEKNLCGVGVAFKLVQGCWAGWLGRRPSCAACSNRFSNWWRSAPSPTSCRSPAKTGSSSSMGLRACATCAIRACARFWTSPDLPERAFPQPDRLRSGSRRV